MQPLTKETLNSQGFPKFQALGDDLLQTTSFQRYLALIRPFLALTAFILAAYANLWWALPFLTFLIFVAVVTVTHDIVHSNMGVNSKFNDGLLFILGAILLESGHAYRASHLYHHRNFPAEDDLEGVPAKLSPWGAILHGPVFIPRLWVWAFKNSEPGTSQRRWLVIEALWPFVFIALGIFLLSTTPMVLAYAVLVICGSWVYPFLNVYWLHKDFGDHPLNQSRTVRGWLLPELFLGLTYHLEHHLYPQVPSHNLPELAKRLDPFFEEQGVKPYNFKF